MSTKEAIYDEADRLKEAGQLEEAIAKLHEALAIDPGYALAHTALARFHSRLSQHDKAVEHALKVAELEPQDAFSYTALSVVFMKAGRILEAEDAKARAQMLTGHKH